MPSPILMSYLFIFLLDRFIFSFERDHFIIEIQGTSVH